MLEPISPLAFTEAGGSAVAAGSAAAGAGSEAQGGRPPTLGVGRHPAAMSVVARKMLKRVQVDPATLTLTLTLSLTPTLTLTLIPTPSAG